jgi:hypothetical protein
VIGIFLLGMFPRPLLAAMEPSVNKFIKDFGRRVGECDGPPHTFGSGVCDNNPAIQKTLDSLARAPPGCRRRSPEPAERRAAAPHRVPPLPAVPRRGSGAPAVLLAIRAGDRRSRGLGRTAGSPRAGGR